MAELSPLATVLPQWVEAAFALADGAQKTFAEDGIAYDLSVEPLRLDPHLRPLRIHRIVVPAGRERQALAMMFDLQAGAKHHRRPIEFNVTLHDLDRDEDPSGYAAMMWRSIEAYDRIGCHVTEGVSYEGLKTVSFAYLPDGLPLTLGLWHTEIGRQVIGVAQTERASKNAYLARLATPAYGYLMEMRAAGYAFKNETLAGRAFFGLTPKGFAAVLRPGERTIWRTIPEQIVLHSDDDEDDRR